MSPTLLRPFCSRRSTRSTPTGVPQIETRDDHRPVQRRPARATRRAAAGSSLPSSAARHGAADAELGRQRHRVRETDPVDAGAPRLPAAASPTPTSSRCSRSTRRGRRKGSFDAGIELALAAHPREPAVPVPRRARSGRRGAGHGVSRQRPRAGVAAVVLPLEQHPGRRAARRWRAAGKLQRPAVLEQQVRRMLADPRAAGAGQQLRRPVAAAAQPAERRCPIRTSFPTSTTTCGRRSGARPSCSSRASCARTAACSIC